MKFTAKDLREGAAYQAKINDEYYVVVFQGFANGGCRVQNLMDDSEHIVPIRDMNWAAQIDTTKEGGV